MSKAIWTLTATKTEPNAVSSLCLHFRRGCIADALAQSKQASDTHDVAFYKAKAERVFAATRGYKYISFPSSRQNLIIKFIAGNGVGLSSLGDRFEPSEWFAPRILEADITQFVAKAIAVLAKLGNEPSPEQIIDRLKAKPVEFSRDCDEFVIVETLETCLRSPKEEERRKCAG